MDEPSPLELIRRQLALAVGENAVVDGWSKAADEGTGLQDGRVRRLRWFADRDAARAAAAADAA